MLLIFAAIIGAPVAVVAFFFLKLIAELQKYLYQTLPGELGFSHEPLWWPLPLLMLAGLIVALTIHHLPGTAGHKPAEGLKMAGGPRPIELPGVLIAASPTSASARSSDGGTADPHRWWPRGPGDAAPEARCTPAGPGRHRGRRQLAAVSTLLGNPLVAAFLLLEVGGGSVGGALLGPLLMPGLLAAGIGTLIFVGLDSWTGFGEVLARHSTHPSVHDADRG